MANITEYLERTMHNCSLIDTRSSVGDGFGMSDEHIPISDRFLKLNSHFSVPSHLEQCLDLKTGEIYYRSWNSGKRVKEDPRKLVRNNNADQFSGESYGTVFSSEEGSSYYKSEESSSESSPSSRKNHKDQEEKEEEDVLVVAGCKACFMYLMVPKLLKDCPKCAAQLLHFDRPHSVSP